MTDRFEEIKAAFKDRMSVAKSPDEMIGAEWLIAEIERGRRIEDALLEVESLPPGSDKVAAYRRMVQILADNPRPGEGQSDG